MTANWSLEACDEDHARSLASELSLPPIVARVLLARGLGSPARAREALEPRLASLPSPESMCGLPAAVDRLAAAVTSGERIAVYGDYDADGITAAALSVTVLEQLGADVRPWVASRFEGGYGLSTMAVDAAADDGRTLLLVLDCGTSDHESVAHARRRGVDVVVVDHHPPLVGPPEAVAFVNPHQQGCTFPDKGLAAVGLAFYVMGVLRTRLGAPIDVRETLDLVALGTVADVAPLDGVNRVLVRRGLERLTACPRPGLAALRSVCRATGRVTSWTIGFQLAPRINAAGRLGRPDAALALLLSGDGGEAATLASQLDELSQQRRTVEESIMAEAVPLGRAQVEEGRSAVVVAGEGWNQGVVGIVAARLCEQLGRPAAVVAIEGETGRGSARAPAGIALNAALDECSDELVRYGGHAAAAGFTVETAKVEAFGRALSEAVLGQEKAGRAEQALRLEAELTDEDLHLDAADGLERLGPFGARNPEPVLLVRGGRIHRVDERRGGHLSLVVGIGGERARAFAPRMASGWPRGATHLDLAVGLRRDDYRGNAVELRVVESRPSTRA